MDKPCTVIMTRWTHGLTQGLRCAACCILLSLWLPSCGGNAPLDPEIRAAIDSTATAQIAKARLELDSLCVVTERMQMAQLVDSIKKIRLKEIEQQMKLVPR